ncbi:MAG: PDZ domain-containing protein [Bacteroidales bacterium]
MPHCRFLSTLVLALALAGCAQPPNTNTASYKGNLRGAGVLPFAGRATVVPASGSAQQDILRMFEDGYGLIEYLDYTGADDAADTAINYARTIGASHVVLNSRYRGTRQEMDPALMLSPLVAALFPKTVVYNQNTALFFAPLERRGVGLYLLNLTAESRKQLASSRVQNGVVVAAVRPGSPGRVAGLQPGDIIVAIDNRTVLDREGFGNAIGEIAGDHTFKLVRGSEVMEARLSVPQIW